MLKSIEFMGGFVTTPVLKRNGEPCDNSKLKWFKLKYAGQKDPGDILACFELIEQDNSQPVIYFKTKA